MYKLEDTFDSLSATLMGVNAEEYLHVFGADEAILDCSLDEPTLQQ